MKVFFLTIGILFFCVHQILGSSQSFDEDALLLKDKYEIIIEEAYMSYAKGEFTNCLSLLDSASNLIEPINKNLSVLTELESCLIKTEIGQSVKECKWKFIYQTNNSVENELPSLNNTLTSLKIRGALKDKDYTNAFSLVADVVKLDVLPENAQLLYTFGLLCEEFKSYDEAESLYKYSIQLLKEGGKNMELLGATRLERLAAFYGRLEKTEESHFTLQKANDIYLKYSINSNDIAKRGML